ncbi:MAG: hypothetical protein ACYC91_03570 [Solirubrobacteraceae bacterium]
MSSPAHSTITLRPAYGDDGIALARLAALDSAERPPEGPLLLVEVDGKLRAAVSRSGSGAIADPFFPTAELLVTARTHLRAQADAEPRRALPRRLGAVARRKLVRRPSRASVP